MPDTTEIPVNDLQCLIGTPGQPVLIDVCIDQDFADLPKLIPTSFRHPFTEVDSLLPRLTGREAVVICQKGQKLSHGAAAILRSHGIAARALMGGILAWHDAGAPLVPFANIPNSGLWVAPADSTITTLSAAWLVRRFVQPDARFLFVPAGQIFDVADRFQAAALDADLPTLQVRLGLQSDPLNHLSGLVRSEDTSIDGLAQLFHGLAHLHSDDESRLYAALPIFDALCAHANAGTGA